MISDDELYRLAIFLGCASMILIVIYHYFEVNADENQPAVPVKTKTSVKATPQTAPASTKPR